MSPANILVHLFVALVLWFLLDVAESVGRTRPLGARIVRVLTIAAILTTIFYHREVFP